MRLRRCTFMYDGNGEKIRFLGVDGFLIEWPEGVDSLTSSFTEGRTPDGVGSTAWETVTPARPVTINGYIMARPSERHSRRLRRAFASGTAGTLTAIDMDGNVWKLGCRVIAAPSIEGRLSLPRFQVQLRADYPMWQAETETVIPMGLNAGADVTIAGDVPALYRANITVHSGTASGIAILDEISGAVLRYDGQVSAGQTLVLSVGETGRISCTLNGVNVINGVSGGLRKLQPGARRLGIYTGGSVTGSAEIIYREALSGV